VKRSELEYSTVSAAILIAEKYGKMGLLVIGSQSILGTWDEDELPPEATASIEVDLVPLRETKDEAVSTLIDVLLGLDSDFHAEHGYYVHGVGSTTAYLPFGWEKRLVPLRSIRAKAEVLCLDPHDLCAAKLMRFEPRDKQFVKSLIDAGLIKPQVLVERIREVDFEIMERPEVGPLALKWAIRLAR
jgi:hypothetical protein